MTKHCRWRDHFGVVTPLENFQIGAAGERCFDSNANLAWFEGLRCDFLDANIFFAVQHSGFHQLVYDGKTRLAEVEFRRDASIKAGARGPTASFQSAKCARVR